MKYRNGLLMTLSYHGERRPPKIALTMPAEEFIAGETLRMTWDEVDLMKALWTALSEQFLGAASRRGSQGHEQPVPIFQQLA